MKLDTVPTRSIHQSWVTGLCVETKCHGGHWSQRRLTKVGGPKGIEKSQFVVFFDEIFVLVTGFLAT